ncbi:GNAT family N-acetyltransferase [Streptomyces sp. NPDC051567]|uniref:GNAT family N-acetyltransferase n=1 Tax=Streptomyces sp. NPDC051567 TaxID=3365660 RepID=UPI0037A3C694
MEPLTLTTARLVLRPFAPADADEVHAAVQDPGIQRWTAVPSPYTREHAASFVGRIAPDGWRDDTAYAFAVRLAPGTRTGTGTDTGGGAGALAGAADLHRRGEGPWEVGYWTAPEHRGRGYTTEAVRALAHWAFTGLGSVRLEWRAEVGNTASRAVAERAGFTVEGVERANLPAGGTLRDCWSGSLLCSDLGLPLPLPYLPADAAGNVGGGS